MAATDLISNTVSQLHLAPFYTNKSMLCDKSVSISQRLAYFDAMVTPVACLAGGHRKIYKQDLREILNEWNARVFERAKQAGIKLWSRRCLEQYWILANYIANGPDKRWLKRALAWTTGRAKIGRPTNTWDSQIHMYCRWKCLGEWSTTAMLTDVWLAHMDSFVEFSSPK